NETDCMVGNPGVAVLADLVLKGYVKDKERAFEALKKSAMCDDRGLSLLKEYGYIPCDLDSTYETVAKGLEYALADAGVAKVAKLLNKKSDYKYFYNRSQSYRRYFDKQTKFMRGLTSEGKFRVPFDPFNTVHRQDDYTEGTAWQYVWLVPHDLHGLVDCFGGERPFVEKFDSLFIVSGDMGAEASPDISGLIGQYAHGNEPSHHVLYIYNYVGQPWKGAKLLRQTMKELYSDGLDGLSGNEDVGQMSSWYVLSSIGLYQVEPSGGKYVFGSPLFDDVTIQIGKGKTFRVKANNNSETNMYVQSVKLNGKPYTKSYIMFDDIMRGGTLEFEMGAAPSKFGTKKADRP
ncbi:MAG: glycoside hydrolase family 92 protein, partial [Prevotella sp.]|nr:glycoside hydrolase family 92 protein [Prevotella sp.]